MVRFHLVGQKFTRSERGLPLLAEYAGGAHNVDYYCAKPRKRVVFTPCSRSAPSVQLRLSNMEAASKKTTGAFYTPDDVAASLVKWVVRRPGDRMLDPACGDGRFLTHHPNCVGVEQDTRAIRAANSRAPWAEIQPGNFFVWAQNTSEKYECAAGNPPFIRYQRFNGNIRKHALEYCKKLGADFSALTSSWAPFLVAAASLLKPEGRMAFVVPAEIGHAPYAVPLLNFLIKNFAIVHLIAVQRKIFPYLSEDCWLLYLEGFGAGTQSIRFSQRTSFSRSLTPPEDYELITVEDWRLFNFRLRPFLVAEKIRKLYRDLADSPSSMLFGSLADVGIGYVTGANDFFHLRPSQAIRARIPDKFFYPAIRNGRMLCGNAITRSTVRSWLERDYPVLLLRIEKEDVLPDPVKMYLESPEGKVARETYKCRVRNPWYVVPDVKVPDAFLSYMNSGEPRLLANLAGCVCTNSVHAVRLKKDVSIVVLQEKWNDPLTRLSCEIEGHPLGGGVLKVEPGEAKKIVIRGNLPIEPDERIKLEEGIAFMRRWRHHALSAGGLRMDESQRGFAGICRR